MSLELGEPTLAITKMKRGLLAGYRKINENNVALMDPGSSRVETLEAAHRARAPSVVKGTRIRGITTPDDMFKVREEMRYHGMTEDQQRSSHYYDTAQAQIPKLLEECKSAIAGIGDGVAQLAELYAGPAVVSTLASHQGFKVVVTVERNGALFDKSLTNFKKYGFKGTTAIMARFSLNNILPLANAHVVYCNPATARSQDVWIVRGFALHTVIECLLCIHSESSVILLVLTEHATEVTEDVCKELGFLTTQVIRKDPVAILKRHGIEGGERVNRNMHVLKITIKVDQLSERS